LPELAHKRAVCRIKRTYFNPSVETDGKWDLVKTCGKWDSTHGFFLYCRLFGFVSGGKKKRLCFKTPVF